MKGPWLTAFSEVMLDAGIAATGLLSIAAVVMLLCRQPARRIVVARAAVLGSLAFIPVIALECVPRFPLAFALQETAVYRHPLLSPNLASNRVSVPANARAGGQSRFSRPVRIPLLTPLYTTGVVAGLTWFLFGWLGVRRLTTASIEPSPETESLYQQILQNRKGGRFPPGLRVSARIASPVIVGMVRPLILIPTEFDQPETRERLRLSLLHELAHYETADFLFSFLGRLAEIFWYPILPLWWVLAQARIDQEFIADRRASGSFGKVGAYASSLLDLARPDSEGSNASAVRAATPPRTKMGGGSPLFRRLLLLLRCPYAIEPRPPAWWSLGVLVMTVALTMGLASISVRISPAAAPGSFAHTHQFRLARLDVPPAPEGDHGRAPIFELPIRLPESFRLNVEVWGNAADLARMRLVGLTINVDSPSDPSEPRAWHALTVRRDPQGTFISLDGQPPSRREASSIPSNWLSLEPPPNEVGKLRNLELFWLTP